MMTMSSRRWSITKAKSELSRLVQDARESPQVLESRGRPVAVVLSTEAYARMAGAENAARRWQSVLALAAEIREEGGVTLEIPRRERPRRRPFA
jgi:prevent-host-death family protein